MKHFIIIFFIILFASFVAQKKPIYTLKNEKLLYYFETKNKKMLSISIDSSNMYIVYRFGTTEKIELEYPNKDKDSWSKFEYSFYLRGGGIENEGLDLNYLTFINNNFKYVIFDSYSANGNKNKIGIQILDLKSNYKSIITGISKTQKGSLVEFRDNNLIQKSDVLYEL